MNIPSYDVWVIARLLAGLRSTAWWRPCPRRSGRWPGDGRPGPAERKTFLLRAPRGRPDAAAWICAIAAVDPEGPAPPPARRPRGCRSA